MRTRLLLTVMLVMLAGCPRQRHSQDLASPPDQARYSLPSADPALEALIARLVATGEYQMGKVRWLNTYGDEHGASFRLFAQIALSTTQAQQRALLHHPSAVVRFYFGEHYLETYPQSAADVAHLLLDKAQVRTIRGCTVSKEEVRSYMTYRLCALVSEPAVRDVLAASLADERVFSAPASREGEYPMGPRILECMTPYPHPRLAETVRRIIGRYEEGRRGRSPDPLALLILPEAVRALSNARDPADLPLFLRARKHRDASVRAAAAFAIGSLAPPDATNLLIEMAKDEPGVRAAAAIALGALAPPEATPPLRAMLKDGDGGVRRAAAEALVMLPSTEDSDIEGLLASPGDIARGARKTLAHKADARSLKLLRGYLMSESEKSWDEHQETMGVLLRKATPVVAAFMEYLLGSRDDLVRSHAENYLRARREEATSDGGAPAAR